MPSIAAGAEPGVTYDPGSPAGKEYAIPLEDARTLGGSTAPHASSSGRQSAPDGRAGTPAAAGGPVPLFGLGITAARGSAQPLRAKQRARGLRSSTPTRSSPSGGPPKTVARG